MKNPVPVLFITYNRLEYSKRAMEALLKTTWPIRIFVWDNGSTDGTRAWLHGVADGDVMGECVHEFVKFRFNHENVGINAAFNWFIRENRDAEFLAKVDNDTIVEPDWLNELMRVMELRGNIDVCGAFMQRPPGQWSFQEWVDAVMEKEELWEGDDRPLGYLAYNSYTGGTGVLMRTEIFLNHGLLFDKYPCLLGDFTTFQRLIFNGRNVAWFSGTTVKLLNIKVDGKELTNDYPEYDEALKKVRDEGNEWYTKIGGTKGVARFIDENGGRERL